jgi:hypothetical protein
LVADEPQPDQFTPAPAPAVTVDSFYDTLAPYGNWVNIPDYGQCWQPGVTIYNHDWQPYGDHGHWVYTDSGWYWASDYSWGWAPFHYGRWFHHDRLGWCWRPDTIWGPSWVTWRYSDDYCGWAPLPPGAYYQDGVGFVFNGGAVGVDFDFGLSPDVFLFVGINDFCDPFPIRHRIDRSRAVQIYHQTSAVNHFAHNAYGFVNQGIDAGRIARVTHTDIRPVSIHATAGVAGRLSPGGSAARAAGAVYPNRPQTAPNQFNRSTPAPNPGPYRASQPYNAQIQERPGSPAPMPNRYYPSATQQRPFPPMEAYRPSTPAPEPRRLEPAPEPRAFMPSAAAVRPERPEPAPAPQPAPQPAQVRNNNPQPAASSSSSSSSSSKSNKNGN